MIERNQVYEGMTVRSADGVALGRVLTCDETSFVVEEELFGADYVIPYAAAMEASGDEIRLALSRDRLMEALARRDDDASDEDSLSSASIRYHDGLQPLSYGDEGGGGLL